MQDKNNNMSLFPKDPEEEVVEVPLFSETGEINQCVLELHKDHPNFGAMRDEADNNINWIANGCLIINLSLNATHGFPSCADEYDPDAVAGTLYVAIIIITHTHTHSCLTNKKQNSRAHLYGGQMKKWST